MSFIKKLLLKLNSSYTIKKYSFPIYKKIHKKIEKDIEEEKQPLYIQAIKKIEVGDYRAGIRLLNEVLLLDHKFILAYNYRAQAKIILGEYEEAIWDCNLSIKHREINPTAYTNRGFAYYNLGYIKEAREDYNRALFLLEKLKCEENREEIEKLKENILENIELLSTFVPRID